jgi:circadian clock protein KaiB
MNDAPPSTRRDAPAAGAADVGYQLRLYVAGALPNSLRARQNLQALCDAHLAGRYALEVIDVLEEPDRLLADGVVVTPTLVIAAPGPRRTVIGTLTDRDALLRALALPAERAVS